MVKKKYIKEVINRVEFYILLSGNDKVMFKTLTVYQNKIAPEQYYIHLKYDIKDFKNKITSHEEIETCLKLHGGKYSWRCIYNQDKLKELKKFIEKSTLSEIKTDNVKLK